jgi:hypothetical protein
VPPVANAQVSLAFPEAAIGTAELISAVGAVTRSGRTLRAEVGPTDRIVARWRAAGSSTELARADVSELLWLRVKSGAVSLRAKWVFEVHRGQIRRFRLAADRQLRLNGDFRDGSGTKLRAQTEVVAGPRTAAGSQIFTLSLDPPRSGRFSVEGDFLVEDMLGIGRLRFPQISGRDMPIDRRWLALSVDADLKYEENRPRVDSRAGIGEFLAAWGDQDGQPLVVRSGDEIEPTWLLNVQPRESRRAVQQTLRTDFGLRRADVKFQADVTITGGPCFHHHLTVPTDFVVEHVMVREGERVRDIRWTATSGAVDLFLRERAAGSQRLELTGYLPIPVSGNVTVPAMQLDQAVTTSAETRVYQQPAVRLVKVAVEGPKVSKKPAVAGTAPKSAPAGDAVASESAVAISSRQQSRFVGAFVTPPGTRLLANVAPNRPSLRAPILVTGLRKSAEAWMADVWFDSVVADHLDAITLTGPASLGKPEFVEPAGRVEQQIIGDQCRWRYLPDAPLTGAAHVRLTWRLPPASGQRVAVPEIDVLTTSATPRLIAVAKSLSAPPEAWEADGLVRLNSLDEVLRMDVTKGAKSAVPQDAARDRRQRIADVFKDFDLYRAPLESPAALRRSSASQGAVNAVRASVEWHAASDVDYRGVARFELTADSASSLRVRLPEQCRLLRSSWVTVDGPGPTTAAVPLLATQDDEGTWRINLGPQLEPRWLELEFAGSLASPLSGDCRLEAPQLIDVQPTETQWTVVLPPQCHVRLPEGTAPRWVDGRQLVSLTTSGAERHLARLEIEPKDTDSLAYRFAVLVALLVSGGGVAWTIERFQVAPRFLVWLGIPLGLAWWFWLRPSALGLAIAAMAAAIGLAVTLKGVLDREKPTTPSAQGAEPLP